MSGDVQPAFDTLYLLRHGETEFNRRGLTLGSLDLPLTPTGRDQAAAAAARLPGLPIAGFHCSPALRCRETAAFVTAVIGREPRIVPDLAERRWGELEGLPRALKATRPLPPSVEALDEFNHRVRLALTPLESHSLVVTHSGVFRSVTHWLGVSAPEGLGTGALVRFRRVPGGFQLDEC
jgi:probable phosphoglycerate mutase